MFTFVLKIFNTGLGFVVFLLILIPIGVHLTNPLTAKKEASAVKQPAEKKAATNVTKTSK